ncbi:MAG: DUF3467 domain-containing protein [Anaerolineales bacterium]|nr:DUF3467 domain-containing protein [Anaerolineae bacterium]MCB9129475.1 DUF3467 domain-containing protein [Anaerolineales bacterium]
MVAEQPTPRQLNVELPNDLTATYANFAIISHSPHEVVVDFAQMLPGMPKAKVQTRVLLTPANAKMLWQALGQNIAKYERRFGKIGAQQAGGFDPKSGILGGMQWTVGGDDPGDEPEPDTDAPEKETS